MLFVFPNVGLLSYIDLFDNLLGKNIVLSFLKIIGTLGAQGKWTRPWSLSLKMCFPILKHFEVSTVFFAKTTCF